MRQPAHRHLRESIALRSSGRLWITVQTGPGFSMRTALLGGCYRLSLIARRPRIRRDIREPLEYGRIGLGI